MLQALLQRSRVRPAATALALAAVAFASAPGCNSGRRSDTNIGIPGVNQAAPHLDVDNWSYRGPAVNTLRYAHRATTLEDGKVLITGGSDERLLTSIEVAEVFDQTLFDDPQPESKSGVFIDTDVNGDPMNMVEGGRVYHTATLLSDGTVLIAGGSFDSIIADAYADAEIFDPQSRLFNPPDLQPESQMIQPRFRHTATHLPNGKVLIVGGQRSVQETIVDPNFPPGSPQFQFDVTVFPSTKSFEQYNPANREFESVPDITSGGLPTELQTTRGRSDHAAVAVAGFDNVLGTTDDIILFAAGFQTLSGIFAPGFKDHGQPDLDLQTSLEYFDSATGANALSPGIAMTGRANGSIFLNLGEFATQTPDGVDGVNNVALMFGGDSNGEACTTGIAQSEIVVCSFTGFGPAQGIQLQRADPAGAIMGLEGVFNDTMNCFPVGRTASDGLMMQAQRVYDGVEFASNWAVTGGGEFIYPVPGGCMQAEADPPCAWASVNSFTFYDPFYNVEQDPPWDLTVTRTTLNPTGVVGTWIESDADISADTIDSFADGSLIEGYLVRARVGHTLSRVPGEDGILRTPDDRLLVVGGGDDWWTEFGAETVSVGSEIYLPPGANGT